MANIPRVAKIDFDKGKITKCVSFSKCPELLERLDKLAESADDVRVSDILTGALTAVIDEFEKLVPKYAQFEIIVEGKRKIIKIGNVAVAEGT
jgi:hypothetical protein